MEKGYLGSSPEASDSAPLSIRLASILEMARETVGVASTIGGRTFGFPGPSPTTNEAAKLQVARVDSIETTIDDLSATVRTAYGLLTELNNRI